MKETPLDVLHKLWAHFHDVFASERMHVDVHVVGREETEGGRTLACLKHPVAGLMCDLCIEAHWERAHAKEDGSLVCGLCGGVPVVGFFYLPSVEPEGGGFRIASPGNSYFGETLRGEFSGRIMPHVLLCDACKKFLDRSSPRGNVALN